MPDRSPPFANPPSDRGQVSRRRLGFCALAALLTSSQAAVAASRPGRPVVTILGDSITAGLGLPASQSLPAKLQAALAARGLVAEVRGAGVSGDTSAGGLARLDFSVQPDTSLCIVELGGNDYLQSIDPKETEANLSAIVQRLKARGIKALLLPGATPAHASGAYGRAFDAIFPAVAKQTHVRLGPDLFRGLSGDAGFRQADGLHPNAKGVDIIADRLAPAVIRLLAPA